jgi:hypothetical protein
MSKNSDRIAYAEDAEEDSGSSVEGIESTRRYAKSEAPASPIKKERPNTSKSRSAEKRPSQRRVESSSTSNSLTDSSDSTAHPAKKEREARRISPPKAIDREQRERDKKKREQREQRKLKEEEEDRRLKAEARGLKKVRPQSLKHAVTQPVIQQSSMYKRGHVEDPSCYGVPQPAVSGSRPRAQTRPASYYAGQTSSRPPIANAGWHQSYPHQSPAPGPPPPPPLAPPYHAVGTFPPPPHMMPPSPASQMGRSPSHLVMPGYFDAAMANQQHGQHRDLRHRFDSRPTSAMGLRSSSMRGYAPEEFDSEVGSTKVSRRPSRSSKKHDEDKRKMPPPALIPKRPQSAMPQSSQSPFAPPPPPQIQRASSRRPQSRPAPLQRRSVGFSEQTGYEDDDFQGDVGVFHDMSPVGPYEPRRTPSGRIRGFPSVYEHQQQQQQQHGLDIMPSPVHRGAVAPYIPGGMVPVGSYGTSYEADAYINALQYQEEVSGPQMPLTAETLRKASKRGGVPSSRSTRSSGSRDDSEYRRSNTTGTGITRSSSGNNDDVVIKFSGTSVVRLPGAEIECSDGEIMFYTRPGGGGGSDRASTIFQIEDGSRGRMERKALPLRARAPSQSDAQSRGYAPSHAPYDPTLSPPDYF